MVSVLRMLRNSISFMILVAMSLAFPAFGQTKRPVLIRDTDKAEGKDEAEVTKPKEYDPSLAEKSFNIGNFYYKKKNYDAAVDRYREALEYRPDLVKARDALQRACTRALADHEAYIRKNPNALDLAQHREKIAKLEKALAELKLPKPQ